MPDYSNSKIYAIRFNDDDKALYIGSTIQGLKDRFLRHKFDINCSIYKYVKSHYDGDWKKCYINLIRNV